ncbi:MAG: S8 family serine peptidase [Deltaproteobacteria bacterium]|nr:S8 family serine peptidase [Deltaproteobacteria bacterium]
MRHTTVRALLLGLLLAPACDDGSVDDVSIERSALEGPAATRRYIVTYDAPTRGLAATRRAGGTIVRELPAGAAVLLSDAAAARLARDPEVRRVEVDPERVPDGLGAGETIPYGLALTQADQLVDGPGEVTVCIIDSGFAVDHEDLQDADVEGVEDAVYGTSWMDDQCGHGTHVGGIIAALDNDVGVVGVSSSGGLRIRAVKVFVGPTCEKTYGSDLIAALASCRAGVTGRLVVSMSLGGDLRSAAEEAAFAAAAQDGVLMVASAGNGGTTTVRYPAAYASVIAVGAVHQSKAHWASSQRFAAVELAAPGVGVASTVPWSTAAIAVGGDSFGGRYVLASGRGVASGTLVDGGSCSSVGATWGGKIVRCRLGSTSFATQVQNAQSGGAVGVLLYSGGTDYNDTPYLTLAPYSSALPVLGLNRRDGEALAAFFGQPATLDTTKVAPASGYEAWNGTSMAVPYVSGIAAKIWSHAPAASNTKVRWALAASAQDLGTTGRDTSFGFGLVQGASALGRLQTGSCKANGTRCASATDCCSLTCSGKGTKAVCK